MITWGLAAAATAFARGPLSFYVLRFLHGLVLSADEDVLFVAMTRDNAVWRLPLLEDGSTGKLARFASFHGTSGPDGIVMDAAGNLLVAHASLGAVFVLDPQGVPLARTASCRGLGPSPT